MKAGTKLIVNWTETFVDHVTKGKEYEVVKVDEIGFYIINDKGEVGFPISTGFTRLL